TDRRHRRPGSGRDGDGDRPPADPRPHPRPGAGDRKPVTPARRAPPSPPRGRGAGPLDHRLHERGKEHAAQRPDRQRGRGRRQALHDPRSHQPPATLPARGRGGDHRHRGLHRRSAQGPRRRLPRDPGRAGRRRPSAARGGRFRSADGAEAPGRRQDPAGPPSRRKPTPGRAQQGRSGGPGRGASPCRALRRRRRERREAPGPRRPHPRRRRAPRPREAPDEGLRQAGGDRGDGRGVTLTHSDSPSPGRGECVWERGLGGEGPGLYLHIPFCSAICPYCDFAVLTGGPQKRARFVEHLLAEIRMWRSDRDLFPEIDTIYFGGGTPSALAPEQIALVLDTARENLSIRDDAWIFFEANPEDVTPESARAWRDLGVRMLSLGVQSFDAEALRFLGRRHTPEEARRSVEIARDAGFEIVSIDLIYGLPDQPPTIWSRTLAEAVALRPDHISCYQLTIHEGTPFGFRLARGKMTELPEAAQADLFLMTHRFLADHGYPGYEVSNFARSPEHQSRHN